MAFFAEFLRVSEMFDRLVADAPFKYTSNNAPSVRNVVGTMVLAMTIPSSRSTAIRRGPNSATIRKSRDGRATTTTRRSSGPCG